MRLEGGKAIGVDVVVHMISDTLPLPIVFVIASPSPSVILSEAKNLSIRLRINSAQQSHLTCLEIASVALGDLAMTRRESFLQ